MKNYYQKSENFWKRTRLLSRLKIKLDVRVSIWRLQLLSWEKKLVLRKDSSVHFSFLWNAEGNKFKGYKVLKIRLCVGNTHSLLKSFYKFD